MQFSRRSPVHCSKEASEGAANLNALDEYGDLRFTIRDKWKKAIDGNCGSVPTVKQIFNIFHVHENCHWSTAKNYDIKKLLQNITHERKKRKQRIPYFNFASEYFHLHKNCGEDFKLQSVISITALSPLSLYIYVRLQLDMRDGANED